MIPPDIEENIFTALNAIFTYQLITIPQQQGDSLLPLKTLQLAPLQLDPTSNSVSPYLIYEKDPERGVQRMTVEQAKEYGDTEIGGPLRYLLYCHAKMGTPLAVTRNVAQQQINALMTRVMQTLVLYYDLSGINRLGAQVSPDLSEQIEGANMYVIDRSLTHIYGGEQTWYGEGEVWWHYPVSWYIQARTLL